MEVGVEICCKNKRHLKLHRVEWWIAFFLILRYRLRGGASSNFDS